MNDKGNPQHFKISSYLKTILGKDLITDDFVAIFELVKNSFDAHAKTVSICFKGDELFIIDDGKGMSEKDLLEKWLFVAYSAKREGIEDRADDYRNQIKQNSTYAGSKGVGRFSCDRLGESLLIQSRTAQDEIQILDVNWDDFEESSDQEFNTIPIYHRSASSFQLPDWVPTPINTGTILGISKLRSRWSRETLLDLKNALSKLINPFGGNKNEFSIEIIAPDERKQDKNFSQSLGNDIATRMVVNGVVENFIFETLEQKTTWLRSWLDKNDKRIYTELSDRGKLIYKISEPLEYSLLEHSNYEANIYYLNRSAKTTFTRRMGIPSVKFGSIFLFKNGFRVYPIGEEADDSFGIDRRKQQGYARYLGTRDVLGRIDIYGDETDFRESSSRDKGLIETPAYKQLEDCFKRKALYRLENYVVGVSWRLKYDQDLEDSNFLSGDDAKANIINVVSKLCDSEDVRLENYAEDILSVIDNKISGFDKTIQNLEAFAEKAGNKELADKARKASSKFEEMQRIEAEAIAYAEREREAREKAEKETQIVSNKLEKASDSLKIEKEKNIFLTSQQDIDKDILENLHHQIIIHASNAINHIEASLLNLSHGVLPSKEQLSDEFSDLLFIMQQVISASRFATSANFKVESSFINEDLPSFITQYIERICPLFEGRVNVKVKNTAKNFIKKFKPIEVSIIIDNLIDNSSKSGSGEIFFEIDSPESNAIRIFVTDDGAGLDPTFSQPNVIFDKGVTTTSGSGIGLYYIKQLLGNINGNIYINDQYQKNGMQFEIRIYK
jgi:hypothetical protein